MNEGLNAVSLITGYPNHQVQFRVKQAFRHFLSSMTGLVCNDLFLS